VAIDRLMDLAANADMPQVRAIATHRLARRMQQSGSMTSGAEADQAHHQLLAADIKRFLDRPHAAYARPPVVDAPPGAPIGGDTGMEFLRRLEPVRCDWTDNGRWVLESCRW
jgi:hypothetical protein